MQQLNLLIKKVPPIKFDVAPFILLPDIASNVGITLLLLQKQFRSIINFKISFVVSYHKSPSDGAGADAETATSSGVAGTLSNAEVFTSHLRLTNLINFLFSTFTTFSCDLY